MPTTLDARQEQPETPPLHGDGTDRDKRLFWQGSGRTLRLALLLLLIATALAATTFPDRAAQVLLRKDLLVVFLSVLPGWLYLQFITIKGTVLYDEYVLNLYRLKIDDLANLPKPPPGSRYWRAWDKNAPQQYSDAFVARNIYPKKFEAVYGRSAKPESKRQRHGADDRRSVEHRRRIVEQIQADAFSPVIMSTILLCVGWIAVIQPELYLGLRPFGDIALSGLPEMPIDPLRYGFIGSYMFIVQGLVRRYFQADLKTHAYVSAIARVLLVAALVTAIHPLWSEWGLTPTTEVAFAFFLGFFPELGVRVIQRGLIGVLRKARPAGQRSGSGAVTFVVPSTLGAGSPVAPAPVPTVAAVEPNTGAEADGDHVVLTELSSPGATTVTFGTNRAPSFGPRQPARRKPRPQLHSTTSEPRHQKKR